MRAAAVPVAMETSLLPVLQQRRLVWLRLRGYSDLATLCFKREALGK